jgi:hypothetical protein
MDISQCVQCLSDIDMVGAEGEVRSRQLYESISHKSLTFYTRVISFVHPRVVGFWGIVLRGGTEVWGIYI